MKFRRERKEFSNLNMGIQSFNKFFKDSQTNWKYVLIVVILAFFVGGGILSYCYLWSPKQEIPLTQIPKIKKPEKIEKITKTPTIAGKLRVAQLSRVDELKRIYVSENYAYTLGEGKLTVISISDPRNPEIIGSISDQRLEGSISLSVLDKYVYVVTEKGILMAIDVHNPAFPKIVGSISDKRINGARGIQILDKYAYVIAGFPKVLFLINISDPETLKIENSISVGGPSRPSEIFLSDKYVYISSWGSWGEGADAFSIVDISQPTAPKIVGSIGEGSLSKLKLTDAKDLYVSGKYAYVIAEYPTGPTLVVIDVYNPRNPTIVGWIKDLKLKSSKVYVSGKFAYLAGKDTLTIIDISNPKMPRVVSSISNRRFEEIRDIYVSGRYVYLINNLELIIIDIKGEITQPSVPIEVLSKEPLELEENFVAKNEREFAFLQEGDIWVISKDLKKKYKVIDTKEAITNFSFSPDGKIVYWLNEKGEIWKKNEKEEIYPLITVEKDMKKEFQEIPEEFEEKSFSYYKGEVENFWLSPDGNYITYETLEGYTSCCAGPPTIPFTWIWIMKNDGTKRVSIEKPTGVWRSLIYFDGWIPSAQKFLFHLNEPDEATQGTPFFEVSVDGKNPKLYTEIFKIIGPEGEEIDVEKLTPEKIGELTTEVIGTEPVYSPSGEKVAYIQGWKQIRFKNIKTNETKTILELKEGDYFPFGSAYHILKWSDDGILLLAKTNNMVYIFNQNGKIIFKSFIEAEEIKNVVFSPDNKYVAGSYRIKGKGIDIIFFINLITKEKKEFKIPEFGETPEIISISSQFFADGNRFYYLMNAESEETKPKPLFPQLWVIDTNAWKNYKVVDNVSKVVRVP